MAGIFDLLPQPTYEPVPLDESERIQELTKQLGLLSPQTRMQEFDPLGLKTRSSGSVEIEPGYATTKRTFGDNAKSALNLLFEGIRAAGSGRQYQNPWERQRQIYEEDYKREAPRLIDELKILNQNKRAFEEQQSRTKIQQAKDKAMLEAAKIKADVDTLTANNRRMSERERIDIQKRLADLRAQGVYLPPEWQIAMHQVGKNLEQIASDPEAANAVSTQYNVNNATKAMTNAAAKSIFNPISQVVNLSGSTQRDSAETGEKTTYSNNRQAIMKGVNPAGANFLQQLLSPQGQQGALPFNIPGQPQQGQPGQQRPSVLPGLPQPSPANQPQAKPSRPLDQQPKLPVQKPQNTPGAAATQRADIFGDDGSTFYKKAPDNIDKWRPQDFDLDKNPNTAKLMNAALYDDVVGYQPTQDGRFKSVDNPNTIITPKFHGPPAVRRKQKQDFETFRDATYALNSFAALVARQYVMRGKNLMTGTSGTTGMPAEKALEWNQTLRDGPLKKGADAVTTFSFGRTPDNVDQYIALLTTESYLRKIYESTGKQLNENEMREIKKTWVALAQNPDAFVERLMQLTIKANRKLYQTYKNFEQDNKRFDLGDLNKDYDSYAVANASRVLTELKKGKYNAGMLRPDLPN